MSKLCYDNINSNNYRQCPRLNRRFAEETDGLIIVKRILGDIINEVLEAETDTQEEIVELEEVEQHKKTKRNVETWVCPICFVKVKHPQNIARHQSLNCLAVKVLKVNPKPLPIPTEYECDFCDAKYSIKTSLKREHLEEYCLQNKQSLFTCPVCDFKTNAERFLKGHMARYHMEEGTLTCEFCDKKYRHKDSLRVHIKKSHLVSKQSFVCHICGSVLPSKAEYDKHNCVLVSSKGQGPHTSPVQSNYYPGPGQGYVAKTQKGSSQGHFYGNNSSSYGYGSKMDYHTFNQVPPSYDARTQINSTQDHFYGNNSNSYGYSNNNDTFNQVSLNTERDPNYHQDFFTNSFQEGLGQDLVYEVSNAHVGGIPDWLGSSRDETWGSRTSDSKTVNISEAGGQKYMNL